MGKPKGAFKRINGQNVWQNPYTAEEESALVARIKAGDQQACGELARDYLPMIRRMTGRYADSFTHAEPEDVAQVVLEKLLTPVKYQGYEPQPGKNIGHWIATITSNAIVSELREQSRDERLFVSADQVVRDDGEHTETLLDTLVSEASGPTEDLASRTFARLADKRIEDLPRMQGRVVRLLLEEKSIREIAGTLAISEGTVKTHTARARRNLTGLKTEMA